MTTPAKRRQGAPGIAEARRAEIIADLNAILVDLIDLSLSAKQAHWNVEGPNFQGLHELFDEVTDFARAQYDEVAERVRALGGTTHATLQDVHRTSSLKPFPTDERDWQKLSTALVAILKQTSMKLHELIESTEDDMPTQDMYIAIQFGIDKKTWMVEAHLR
jgi:starvation-inducible DNA-binding protein